jgi:site-specific recombinase XerD
MDEGIAGFISSLSVVEGFSPNTLDAYKNDLNQFADFIRDRLLRRINCS